MALHCGLEPLVQKQNMRCFESRSNRMGPRANVLTNHVAGWRLPVSGRMCRPRPWAKKSPIPHTSGAVFSPLLQDFKFILHGCPATMVTNFTFIELNTDELRCILTWF